MTKILRDLIREIWRNLWQFAEYSEELPVREIKTKRIFNPYREMLDCDENKEITPKSYEGFQIFPGIREIWIRKI